MISQKVFDPRHRLVLGGKGRRPEAVARCKVSRARIRTADPFTTSKYSLLLPAHSLANSSATLGEALRCITLRLYDQGAHRFPIPGVTIHYVCVSYIRYVSPYISLGARIHL